MLLCGCSTNGKFLDDKNNIFTFVYNDNADGYICRIIKTAKLDDSLVFPTSLKEKVVYAIGNNGCDLSLVKTVSIPNTVVEIEQGTFYLCAKLDNIYYWKACQLLARVHFLFRELQK